MKRRRTKQRYDERSFARAQIGPIGLIVAAVAVIAVAVAFEAAKTWLYSQVSLQPGPIELNFIGPALLIAVVLVGGATLTASR